MSVRFLLLAFIDLGRPSTPLPSLERQSLGLDRETHAQAVECQAMTFAGLTRSKAFFKVHLNDSDSSNGTCFFV